ncbi:BatA domain-containing protein [Spirosoma flavum]|uniref:BatA domain-containing protein n=1 Tax=Spirosoma flavum TaxID=2048557 RepID=A0ABW6AME7_9BACT
MQFVEPFLLWGALAVAIPMVIHFWHQKQGKPLPWAATQWLIEKQQQQSRGLRLDNIPLLIIRCLLLVLLAILLAQPILNWFSKPPAIQKVHLVQPNTAVLDNFKFELTAALKKDERVIWATDKIEPVTEPLSLPQQPTQFSSLGLQTAINRVDSKNTELHLYFVNSPVVADVPAITVPARFRLHTVIDSIRQPRPYLVVKNDRKLFVNRVGKLTSVPVLDPTLKFSSTSAYSGPIQTLLNYRNGHERQTVKAALEALTDIYSLDLKIDEKPVPNRTYTWVLTDQPPTKPSPQTLYIISGLEQPARVANVVFTNESLTPQTSERVSTGQLPEWLGTQLLGQYGLDVNNLPLSQQDLKTLFITSTKPTMEQHAGVQNALLLFLVILLIVERWLALTKNA